MAENTTESPLKTGELTPREVSLHNAVGVGMNIRLYIGSKDPSAQNKNELALMKDTAGRAFFYGFKFGQGEAELRLSELEKIHQEHGFFSSQIKLDELDEKWRSFMERETGIRKDCPVLRVVQDKDSNNLITIPEIALERMGEVLRISVDMVRGVKGVNITDADEPLQNLFSPRAMIRKANVAANEPWKLLREDTGEIGKYRKYLAEKGQEEILQVFDAIYQGLTT